jgi:hypothetical protein
LEALGINLPFFLVQVVNLIIVYVVVAKWIVGPISGLLEKRRATIAQGLEDAREAADARANAEKEAEKILAEAQTKAASLVAKPPSAPKPPDVMSKPPLNPKLEKPAKRPWPRSKKSAAASWRPARAGGRPFDCRHPEAGRRCPGRQTPACPDR